MFSEYASRFLAQSQSRIGPRPDEVRNDPRPKQHHGRSRFPISRPVLPRTALDPYQPTSSQISNLPFGSRSLARPAPLFYSATDDFREEDDETERDREIADFYALQRSRRQFGGSRLKDSSEMDDDDDYDDDDDGDNVSRSGDVGHIVPRRSKGIRSSWRDGTSTHGARSGIPNTAVPDPVAPSHKGREDLFDVRLEDTVRSVIDFDKPNSEIGDDDPPSVQRFREQPESPGGNFGIDSSVLPAGTGKQSWMETPRQAGLSDPNRMSIPREVAGLPAHDVFWGQLFLISLACLLATAFLVYLHTSAPSGDKSKWGDTVYLTVHGSFSLLGAYTVVSIFVSLLWLALLRSYVRPLVYVIMFAVPVILYSFSIYPFISSFKGAWHGTSIQDRVMRFGSLIPFLLGSLWTYNVIRGRYAIGKAIGILEFACRILAANTELLALGLGILTFIVSWTWVWMLMFTRVFLGGHVSESKNFIINISSWWLAIYFIIVYIWSLGVVGGIQRAVTAATVSQWYFHRLANPAPTSRQVVQAATVHSSTTLFGTICLSRLIALLVRLPLILLPSRIASFLSLLAYSLVPTPLAALSDPLALTYGAIHSQPLNASARGLSRMKILSSPISTPSLRPSSWSHDGLAPLLPYRLSKLILHAARLMMSLALGFGGWVSAARNLGVPAVSSIGRGSVYAYVVGLIAGTIGWSVLGTIEGIIADIVDASIICWGSEVGIHGREARYCREAGWLFGDEPNPRTGYARDFVEA
ncbi:choline transporter-like protein [Aspergillus steynii IBT 23096]|uniref:Protein PNS1 n=1 Tax=Aspergillus steynii IBT 23096 TaxID=1392250 RepID=A0A2I2FXJ0_9EURO|nr:choline transporter-like protein [Aspergillus steynii IBT 23096]PLB45354.1 choline transporter-like protein [Aspergillus steynii IBT 23096]